MLVFGSLALAVYLGIRYTNEHEWNRVLWWPEVTFTLLRNWPLVWMDQHVFLRYLSGGMIVTTGWTLALAFRGQHHRAALWLWVPFAVVLLGTNHLVEPRYFITPAALLLLFLELDRRDYAWLAAWFFLINAVHAPFILRGLALW